MLKQKYIMNRLAAFMWIAGTAAVSVMVGGAYALVDAPTWFKIGVITVGPMLVAAAAASRVNSLYYELETEIERRDARISQAARGVVVGQRPGSREESSDTDESEAHPETT